MSLVECKKPKAVTPLEFFEAVYMNPDLPLGTRLRAATEAAKYVRPRLMAIATYNNGDGFADQLEQRRRSRIKSGEGKLIEAPSAKPVNGRTAEEVSAEHMQRSPYASMRRRI